MHGEDGAGGSEGEGIDAPGSMPRVDARVEGWGRRNGTSRRRGTRTALKPLPESRIASQSRRDLRFSDNTPGGEKDRELGSEYI